jgi:undecaprenyl phosphate N,N'-diacetylbacillosamine 1-phosphate transferase
MYRKWMKPFFDRGAALVLLLALFPVWGTVMLVLAIVNRGDVWFCQSRPGQNGTLFVIWKFKTMTDKRDVEGNLLPDHLRMTVWGRIIRKTSMDELPQLFNVLGGSMSLVGPRPLLPEYLPLYNTWQHRRHEVKPGITGWAQIHGRNKTTWLQRFDQDLWYVDHQSFWLDLKILFLTLAKVVKAEGVQQRADVQTMERFKGNEG